MGRVGFEPTKAIQPTDLQSAPFGHSGTSPHTGAGDPTRTDDLLITSQLLYQLSYTGKNALCASINIPKGQSSVKGFWNKEFGPSANAPNFNDEFYLNRRSKWKPLYPHGRTDVPPPFAKKHQEEV